MSSSSTNRRNTDVMKLMMSKHLVAIPKANNMSEFFVKFFGPSDCTDSPYSEGVWLIRILLPLEYPFKSPSIGFGNRIFHPNVDEKSGTVCLDVINETWSPMYDLVNIISVFLPQLLMYPNPSSPLNIEAARMYSRSIQEYNQFVRAHIAVHARLDCVVMPAAELTNGDDEDHEDKIGSKLSNSSAISASTTASSTGAETQNKSNGSCNSADAIMNGGSWNASIGKRKQDQVLTPRDMEEFTAKLIALPQAAIASESLSSLDPLSELEDDLKLSSSSSAFEDEL